METEKNNENHHTDKSKENNGQDANMPTKKIKRKATQSQLNHPLHGVKLVEILERLVEYYGWKYLANEVNILCFKYNPTMEVSLKFLRKTKWAREHVEDIYINMLKKEIKTKY